MSGLQGTHGPQPSLGPAHALTWGPRSLFQPSLVPSVRVGAVLPMCLFQSPAAVVLTWSLPVSDGHWAAHGICSSHHLHTGNGLLSSAGPRVKLLFESLLVWFFSVVAT